MACPYVVTDQPKTEGAVKCHAWGPYSGGHRPVTSVTQSSPGRMLNSGRAANVSFDHDRLLYPNLTSLLVR